MYSTAADGGLRGHVPAGPGCITPHIRFLFIAPQLWIGRPDKPRLAATPLPFSLPSALQTWPSDFHRRSNAPCPAHTWRSPALRGFIAQRPATEGSEVGGGSWHRLFLSAQNCRNSLCRRDATLRGKAEIKCLIENIHHKPLSFHGISPYLQPKDYVGSFDTVAVKVCNVLCAFAQWIPLGKNACYGSDLFFIHFRPPCAGHNPAQNS